MMTWRMKLANYKQLLQCCWNSGWLAKMMPRVYPKSVTVLVARRPPRKSARKATSSPRGQAPTLGWTHAWALLLGHLHSLDRLLARTRCRHLHRTSRRRQRRTRWRRASAKAGRRSLRCSQQALFRKSPLLHSRQRPRAACRPYHLLLRTQSCPTWY
jgi:hypothetical protein